MSLTAQSALALIHTAVFNQAQVLHCPLPSSISRMPFVDDSSALQGGDELLPLHGAALLPELNAMYTQNNEMRSRVCIETNHAESGENS